MPRPEHAVALLDWLACAARGAREPAARAAAAAGDGLLERVAAAGTAGHVLDFDDTFAPGLAHLSAPTAPAALVLGADRGASIGAVLEAYAAGFEAMGALAEASHPALYDGGWHPTAVCGAFGAAVAAARLLGLDAERTRSAQALALLRAGGLRAAFGSDGKALQVGMAAASGVHAALLAHAGARVDLDRIALDPQAGFQATFDARLSEPSPGAPPIVARNWIKPWPCCLQSHAPIEAALDARAAGAATDGPIEVTVHPISRAAAALDDVTDGLQARFSIPYLVAFALLHGGPTVDSLLDVDPAARALANEWVRVGTDASLRESAAVLTIGGVQVARIEAAIGSPERPLDAERLQAKVRSLAGDRLDGALEDLDRPAADLLTAVE